MNDKDRRDFFAAHALQGLIAFYGNEAEPLMAVNLADGLIAELDRTGEPDVEREELLLQANEVLDRCDKQIADLLSMMEGMAGDSNGGAK